MDSGTIIGLLALLFTGILVFCPIFFLFIISLAIFLMYFPRKMQETVKSISEVESSIPYEGKGLVARSKGWSLQIPVWRNTEVLFLPDSIVCINFVNLFGKYKFYHRPMQLNFESYGGENYFPLLLTYTIRSVLTEDKNLVITFSRSRATYNLTLDGIVNSSEFQRIIELMPEEYIEMKSSQLD